MTARELILLAHQQDQAAFGDRFGELIDGPDPDAITRDALALLGSQVLRWLPPECDARTAVETVHQRVLDGYPRTQAVLGVNLVVLEHLARSTIGLSDFLSTLDGNLALLYSTLLLGSTIESPAELGELEGASRG